MSEWIDIGTVDVAEGAVVGVDVNGTAIALCRSGGVLHALADRCSHAEARLSEGRLRGGCLVCPRHGAGFDLEDGTPQGPPAITPVATFAVVEDDAGVRLRITPR